MTISRRFLLRGMLHGSAAAMALPFLDCFLDSKGTALAATGKPIPTRFGTYFYGLGLTKSIWVPNKVGAGYEITPQLAALAPLKEKINVLSGFRALTDDKPNHQHWTGVAAISTGVAPTKDAEFDAQTIDVTIANAISKGTRFKSLEVTCGGGARQTYSSLGGRNNNPPETSPIGLYSRLFGPGFVDPAKGDWTPDPKVMVRQSVMSVVADDRKRLMAEVGAADRARLDQYFTSVRQLEDRLAVELERPEVTGACVMPNRPDEMPVNQSVPSLQRVTPLMSELLAIALACNQTRVFNMVFSDPAAGIFFPGDSMPAHQQSHEEPVDETLGYQRTVSKFGEVSIEGFATLLKALDGVKEGDGTLLDHSLVLAYSDSSFAKVHAVDGIAMFLAGGANGKMKTGIHVAGQGGPVTRVGLSVQQALGMPVETWGQASLATNKPISEVLA